MTRFPIAAVVFAATLAVTCPADAVKAKHPPPPAPTTIIVTGYRAQVAAQEGSLRAVWTQYQPGGVLEARAVVDGKACPEIVLDLKRSVMTGRAGADGKFPTVCRAVIPAGTKQAALVFRLFSTPPPEAGAGAAAWQDWLAKESGLAPPGPDARDADRLHWLDDAAAKVRLDIVPLPLPVIDPQRIVVLGDTGCRIKGTTLQDCSDPAKWPFATIAAAAAKLKPDLVIHVGDYLYRESACPANAAGCAGTPFGDNWPTWDADFFAPAKALLAAAPWVIVRGNHEDCSRAGAGWLRLLGPGPFDAASPCVPHLPAYTVPLGSLNMVVLDNADASDTAVTEALVPAYRHELAALADAKPPAWLLLHRPIWAAISGPLGMPAGGNLTLITAAGDKGIASPVELMLAGHIHTFEVLNYARAPHVPPQVVAGFGGDLLDETPNNLRGTIFQGDSGVRVTDGLSVGGFGFLVMTRQGDGWTLDVHDWQGVVERQCVFHAGRIDCPPTRR